MAQSFPPKGQGKYNVVVIGGGTAGLVTAAATAGLGGRVALVERAKMGGDCLNYGCVPSKALIASARAVHTIRRAEDFGLRKIEPEFEFREVFERMRARRARIEPHDSVERFESLGVDVFRGQARFLSPHEVEVDGVRLRAAKFVIAAGSRAGVPAIPGLQDVPYFTNETIFDQLNEKPASLLVIGGGPIGCELAQVFQRLGVAVTILQSAPQILHREDDDVSSFVAERLRAEGIRILLETKWHSVEKKDCTVRARVTARPAGETQAREMELAAGQVLVAAGRVPNVEGLNLEAAGVKYTRRGIAVNDALQTSQPHIYAAGDIAGSYQFTHLADHHARVVVRNILMPWWAGRARVDISALPWSTYVDPEVAHVGLSEKEARRRGIACDVYTQPMSGVDRAIVSETDAGFAKVLTAKGTDKILGVTIVSEHAGDLLHEFVLAMKHGIGLGKIAATIHAYPTYAEIARKLGDQYQRTRLTPLAKKLFAWLYRRARS
jgi:pyruvate/2-oxoglutarate dehydrogenase complex dihydrolipoamide dehydrogenase (E3) component